jgi:hypothetical protein
MYLLIKIFINEKKMFLLLLFFFTFFHVLTEIFDKNTDIDGDLLQTFLVDIFTFQF